MRLNFFQIRMIISLGIPVIYLILTGILDGPKPADIVVAFLAGFISFLLMQLFTSKDSRNVNQAVKLNEDEKEEDEIIIETEARFFVNGITWIGQLILTTDQLTFQALNHEPVEINLSDISAVHSYHFENIFKKGFSVLVQTRELVFEVEYVRDWIDIINYQMKNCGRAELTR